MPGENATAVRRPIRATTRAHRALEERLGLRFPRLLVFAARIAWRQPSRRVRWAAARRALRLAWESFNRGDYEATFMLYRADTESIGVDVWRTLGLELRTRGHADRLAYQRAVRADWKTLWFEPEEVIEVGDDRLLSVGRMKGVGRASGATVDTPWAVVFTIADGAPLREEIFVDRAEALKAAGVAE